MSSTDPKTPSCCAGQLFAAAAWLEHAAQHATVRADEGAADRCARLATAIEHEAEYERNVALGYEPVRRRTDAPADATIGWFVANDAVVRAERSRIGLPR